MGTFSKKEKGKQKFRKIDKEERELRECMHCRYFWGNSSGCIKKKCCKEETNKGNEEKIPEKCRGCPYNQGTGFCFPCMQNILESQKK